MAKFEATALNQRKSTKHKLRTQKCSHAGFTQLELLGVMVAMVIIALLAVYVAPRYLAQVGKSEVKLARAQIDALE